MRLLSIIILILAICSFVFYAKLDLDSKLKFYKSIYVNYMRVCKNKLDSRFSNAALQQAINNAQQQPWVQQQIAADLAPFRGGFTKEDLARWFKEYHDPFNCLVKITVKKGQVIFETDTAVKRRPAYKTVVETISILARKRLIPDCEFIMAINDYLVIVPQGATTAVPIFTFAKDEEIPIEKDLILIPDWMNLCYWDLLRGRLKLANKFYPWQSKKDIIHWRGNMPVSLRHRELLVYWSNYYDFIDAGVTDGPLALKRVDPEFSIKNKYQISLDGARSTWERVVWQMHANTIMLKPKSSQVQWFYRGLVPYENYVPLEDINAENLVGAYKWLQDNDAQAQQISRNANKFAAANLKTQDFLAYYVVLLREYAKLLR